MADATEHPSALLSTAGYALQLLEKEGVDALEFLQRIIDDVECREAVIKIANPIDYYTVVENVDHGMLLEFLDWLFKNDRDEDFSLPELLAQYSKPGALCELFGVLQPREASMLVMLYGLDDSAPAPMGQVISYHRLSPNRASKMIGSARYTLVKQHHLVKYQELIKANPLATDTVSVDMLDLSQRAQHCLRRARIYTIGQLLEKTEDDLLSITNFGVTALREVEFKLAFWNLSLKG